MTVATLRPNSSDAGIHGALSDNSDATYVLGWGEVRLGTVAMAGGVTKTLQAQVRGACVTNPAILIGWIRDAVSDPASGPLLQAVASRACDATITTFSGTPVPVSLSQAQVDALQMLMTSADSNTGAASTNAQAIIDGVRTHELYAILTWVAKPVTVVTAVTPDPYTASNVVPIAWTNTLDADGGAQTRRIVKVFSDAQYLAGGFDPETSTATYDSGEVLGASTGTTVGPLDDDTYRAYVSVAQTVNGSSHWSAWAYDQFAVDVLTSDVATVTATPQNTLARIQIDVARAGASAAWEYLEVERSVDTGATWQPVRLATFIDPPLADAFQVFDYEVANTVNVRYRARATRFVTGRQITGPWTLTAAVVAWTSVSCWLKAPLNPALNMTIRLKSMLEPRRARRIGVFDIVGAAEPVVVSDVLSARTGRLDILVDLDATSPETLLEESSLLLHPPPDWHFPNMHFAPGDVEHARGSRLHEPQGRWIVDVIQTGPPADPTAGA